MKHVISFLCVVLLSIPAFGDDGKSIRLSKNSDNEITSLDIAITSYEKNDLKVDLVGVVHIGDKSYYQELNKRLATYDVVLYELVGFGVVPDPKIKSKNPLVKFKSLFIRILDLDDQLKRVDYKKDNFVHADLSPIELKLAMDRNGDSPATIGLEILASVIRDANKGEDTPPGVSIFDILDDPIELKRTLATQLGSGKALPSGALEKLIIEERNKKVLEIMESQIKAEKKTIAIFYGAAHMPDFNSRLLNDNWTQSKKEWLKAWNLEE